MPDDRGKARRLLQAFDEVQFGASRTLNLRDDLPTADQAVARTEAWLRERQMARAGEVLVITGAGRHSPGGHSVVRAAVAKLLTMLKRRGVVASVREHTAGSFAVRLAPVSALFDAGRRKREPAQQPRPRDPHALDGLEPETRRLLRRLAEQTLERLGTHGLSGRFVTDEMVRQFATLGASVPEGPDREGRLRAAIGLALAELEEGEE